MNFQFYEAMCSPEQYQTGMTGKYHPVTPKSKNLCLVKAFLPVIKIRRQCPATLSRRNAGNIPDKSRNCTVLFVVY